MSFYSSYKPNIKMKVNDFVARDPTDSALRSCPCSPEGCTRKTPCLPILVTKMIIESRGDDNPGRPDGGHKLHIEQSAGVAPILRRDAVVSGPDGSTALDCPLVSRLNARRASITVQQLVTRVYV
ncbi:hypothetical protein RRG08_057826 [Elysia crispata]|uniref:Uncharacterized protein n=1 Tax=Elysia crispata TaxID=231223 RepID=A0AAE1E7P1_9GAST|nr:hypothetical protein RRG08_057826 [Elysia crispata]